MSQITVTTTTPPVTCVLQSIAHHYDGYGSSNQITSGQHDEALPPQLTLRDRVRGSAGLTTILQQQQPQFRCLLRYMPTMPWVLCRWVSLQRSAIQWFLMSCLGAFYGVCFLLSGSCVDVMFTNGGSTIGVATLQSFRVYPWQAYVSAGDGLWPLPGVHWVTPPPTALSKGELPVTHSVFPIFSVHTVGHTALGLSRESPDLSAFPTWWGGVFFSR